MTTTGSHYMNYITDACYRPVRPAKRIVQRWRLYLYCMLKRLDSCLSLFVLSCCARYAMFYMLIYTYINLLRTSECVSSDCLPRVWRRTPIGFGEASPPVCDCYIGDGRITFRLRITTLLMKNPREYIYITLLIHAMHICTFYMVLRTNVCYHFCFCFQFIFYLRFNFIHPTSFFFWIQPHSLFRLHLKDLLNITLVSTRMFRIHSF